MKRLIANYTNNYIEKVLDLLTHYDLKRCFEGKIENFCRYEKYDEFYTEWEIDNWDAVIDTFVNYACRKTGLDKSIVKQIVDKYMDTIMDAISEYFEFYFNEK